VRHEDKKKHFGKKYNEILIDINCDFIRLGCIVQLRKNQKPLQTWHSKFVQSCAFSLSTIHMASLLFCSLIPESGIVQNGTIVQTAHVVSVTNEQIRVIYLKQFVSNGKKSK